jgi:hypothetical protein
MLIIAFIESVMSAISDESTKQTTPKWFPPPEKVVVQPVPFSPPKHPSRHSNHGAKAPYIDR